MACMKCGKEVSEGQVFCEECLAEMERYPVKPGTPLLLPHRDPIVTQRKRRSSRRIRKPEEQVAHLKKVIVWLCVFLVMTTAVAVVSIVLNWKLLGDDVVKLLPAFLR